MSNDNISTTTQHEYEPLLIKTSSIYHNPIPIPLTQSQITDPLGKILYQFKKPVIEKLIPAPFLIEDTIHCKYKKYKDENKDEEKTQDDNLGTWRPNETFVLHFLLDGFISDNLGNRTENVADRFIELLQDGTDWAQSLALEIERGKKYGIYSDTTKTQQSNRMQSESVRYNYIREESKNIPEITEPMIVAGGYKHYSKGGHAVAFRFLPHLNQIIFINSGEGLSRYHQKLGKYYKLYKIWQFPTSDLFQSNSKFIITAIKSPFIDNIDSVYEYQVMSIPYQYEVNPEFKNNGIVSEVTDIWMTSNFIVKDGILYCKPQITGTCSFHSVFWILLLSRWNIGGSLSASHFEMQSRHYLLNKAVNLSLPVSPKISEQISCLQLLTRVYNFPRKNIALKTLLLIPDSQYRLESPHITRTLPTVEVSFPKNKIFDLPQILSTINNSKTVTIALPHLFLLLDCTIDSMTYDITNKNKLLFNFHFAQIVSGAIKYIDQLEILDSDLELLVLAVKCLKYLMLVYFLSNTKYNGSLVNDNHFGSLSPIVTIMVGIIFRIHKILPVNLQLPPLSHGVNFTDGILKESRRCDEVIFIRDYLGYGLSDDDVMSIISPKIKYWINNTQENSIDEKYKFIKIEPSRIDEYEIIRIYSKFINSSVVNQCIAAVFSIISRRNIFINLFERLSKDNIQSFTNTIQQIKTSPWYVKYYKYDPKYTSRLTASNGLAFLEDIKSGIPLTEIDNIPFPSYQYFSELCYGSKTQLLEYKKWNKIITSYAYVLPDKFYSLLIQYMKEVWSTVFNQIPLLINNKKIFPVVLSWLLFLWPSGLDSEFTSLFTLDMFSFQNPISLIFLTWSQLNLETYDFKVLFELSNESELIRLFSESLFYLPETALELLISTHDMRYFQNNKFYMLQNRHLYPKEFENTYWEKDEEKIIKYDKINVVIPIDNDSSWLTYIKQYAERMSIPSVMLQDDEKIYVELHLGSEIVTITSTQLITKSNDIYDLVLLDKCPKLLRQWVMYYENALALPIQQNSNKWFIFLAGTRPVTFSKSVFDKIGNPTPIIYDPCFYIYPMQTCGLMPILTRDTPGWDFLAAHLIDSVKQTCQELIKPFLDTMKDMNHRFKFTTLASAGQYQGNIKREKYLKFLEPQYDNVEDNDCWNVISSSVSSPQIEKYLCLLLTTVGKSLGLDDIGPRPKSQALFETVSGLLLRSDQKKLISDLKHDLEYGPARVRLSLMGSGKSKVIVPMLIILCALNSKAITVIQPEHLVHQTLVTLDAIMPILFPNADYQIISDIDAKRKYLEEEYHDNTRILIFDEIDTMYNPFRSEFNIPSQQISHPIETMPLMKYYKFLVDNCYDEKTFPPIDNQKFLNKFETDLELGKKMHINLNYGISTDPEEYLAIPYRAVDTQIVVAVFSDIDLAGILTCLLRKKSGLFPKDFELLQVRISHWKKLTGIDTFLQYSIDEFLISDMNILMTKYSKNIDIQRFYLESILLPEKLHAFKYQYNLSFIDLMAPAYAERRIGFSGTDLIHIPDFSKYGFGDIVPDPIGEEKIRDVIIGWKKDLGIYSYNFENLWSIIKNYNVLIDCGALLKNYGDSLIIVKKWAQIENDPNIIYVFIDNKDIVKEYKLGANDFPIYKFRASTTFRWYFDQKHVVGIDIEIEEHAKGLTLFRSNNKLMEVAQAIFRLRKLGPEKQSIDFMIKGAMFDSRTQLYDHLKDNDTYFKEISKTKHYLQNTKTIYREELNHDDKSYLEPVKYYSDEVNIPSLTSDFGIWYQNNHKYKSEVMSIDGIEIEHVIEHEQEQEQEFSILNKENKCYQNINFSDIFPNSYDEEKMGYQEPELNISISYDVCLKADSDTSMDDGLCVILFSNGHCKIVTIAEVLLLKAREYNIVGKIVYRNDIIEHALEYPSLLLGLGICGRYLALHEQLIIIKGFPNKERLMAIIRCLHMKISNILLDYINSNLNNILYIKSFTRDYDEFLKRWVRLPINTNKLQIYWNKILKILDQ